MVQLGGTGLAGQCMALGDLSVRGVTYIVVCIRTLLFSKQVMGGQTFSFRP